MIRRRTTLEEALAEIESGAVMGVTAIVVSLPWWESLTPTVQGGYKRRSMKVGLVLRADANLSRHFVELASDSREPPLSTERLV